MNEETKNLKHGGAHYRSFGDLTVRGGGRRSRSSRLSQPHSKLEGGQSALHETLSQNKTTEQIM